MGLGFKVQEWCRCLAVLKGYFKGLGIQVPFSRGGSASLPVGTPGPTDEAHSARLEYCEVAFVTVLSALCKGCLGFKQYGSMTKYWSSVWGGRF